MVVLKRVIKKDVYEHLLKVRDEMYERLFQKYKNDPDTVKYEYSGRESEFLYCKGIAWSEADAATIGREIKAVKDAGIKHHLHAYMVCGCCSNLTVSLPQQNADGDYEIIAEID